MKVESNRIGKGDQHKNDERDEFSCVVYMPPRKTSVLFSNNTYGINIVRAGVNEIDVVDSRFASGQDSM